VRVTRLTGERPIEGTTPDSLLALHDAGYREVAARLGPGWVLDAGCGLGFETVRLGGEDRTVVGVDYDLPTAVAAGDRFGSRGLRVACTDAAGMGLREDSFDYVCSSHIIEHFTRPEHHVSELARVLRPGGTAMILTPNGPADFENPFHVSLFEAPTLRSLLSSYFDDVWIGGLDGSGAVKQDFASRRAKADRILRYDIFDLRHRLPRNWYIALYTRGLPVAYRLLARNGTGGQCGINADDFGVTTAVDATTLVLFAVCRRPRL
jgi:SAM-dependent methyltransferase